MGNEPLRFEHRASLDYPFHALDCLGAMRGVVAAPVEYVLRVVLLVGQMDAPDLDSRIVEFALRLGECRRPVAAESIVEISGREQNIDSVDAESLAVIEQIGHGTALNRHERTRFEHQFRHVGNRGVRPDSTVFGIVLIRVCDLADFDVVDNEFRSRRAFGVGLEMNHSTVRYRSEVDTDGVPQVVTNIDGRIQKELFLRHAGCRQTDIGTGCPAVAVLRRVDFRAVHVAVENLARTADERIDLEQVARRAVRECDAERHRSPCTPRPLSDSTAAAGAGIRVRRNCRPTARRMSPCTNRASATRRANGWRYRIRSCGFSAGHPTTSKSQPYRNPRRHR